MFIGVVYCNTQKASYNHLFTFPFRNFVRTNQTTPKSIQSISSIAHLNFALHSLDSSLNVIIHH